MSVSVNLANSSHVDVNDASVGFSIFHAILCLVLYHDWLEGRGEVSSMFGGYKFVREDRLKKEDKVKDIDTL